MDKEMRNKKSYSRDELCQEMKEENYVSHNRNGKKERNNKIYKIKS